MTDISPTAAQSVDNNETVLSYLLKNAPHDRFPTDAPLHTLHPFASNSPDDPLPLLKDLVDVSAVLSRTLHSFSSFSTSDHKFISILRQNTALVNSLYTSRRDAQQRVKALRARESSGMSVVYGEPIPLDDDQIVDWCISRLEGWGKRNGMEVFKEEEDKDGRLTIMLGGKVLVIDVDLAIQRIERGSRINHMAVSNIKTSHALPSGSSGNALAERSASLDAFILRTWNGFLEEVQKNDVDSSMRAAFISRDIQTHLSYLMKLDSLAKEEGDQGIRWFNETGLMTTVTDRISKTEAESLSVMLQAPVVHLDVFLSRAHALAIPYLVAPSMSFLVHLAPLAYYSLVQAVERDHSKSPLARRDTADPFSKLDVPLSVIREQLTHRRLRPPGAIIATLTLSSVSSSLPDRRPEQRPNLGRPYFRLPGTSMLAALDHILIAPPLTPTVNTENDTELHNVWVLDFTDGGHSSGIVMTHSRMREIQQVIDSGGGMNFALQMQLAPLPGSWIGLLVNPTLPPSERYIAVYKSPSNAHPPLRLRLTVPYEAGFLLQRVPVASLKEVYAVLEIVREQCWINETLKTVEWVAEPLMAEGEDERSDVDEMGAPEEELDAVLKGAYVPKRVPVNVFLPVHPPSFPSSSNSDTADGFDMDNEQAVPGLSSVSMSAGGITPSPSVALAFAVHESGTTSSEQNVHLANGPRQVALVIRHDRSRRRGVRVDINVSSPSDMAYGNPIGERPPARLIEELEETSRRGGTFATAGKVWAWLNGEKNGGSLSARTTVWFSGVHLFNCFDPLTLAPPLLTVCQLLTSNLSISGGSDSGYGVPLRMCRLRGAEIVALAVVHDPLCRRIADINDEYREIHVLIELITQGTCDATNMTA
ncbi:uncharacterized protein FOMMEDRAFT_156063 [Fomitiporia mediterranea MF3/22]|uniref:uncharacterized protein n=1 Tax=Fomitiporia mediterranea (strain MF3/22) TaxID=694068 RepID=UPI0004407D26|nr:uncharacterized protein FOMMEDRAFT_156063 [Fomitiporia mediterranea MF3/22]EJD02730.1 hypothetical protein FOMMEDRAFT_156063 [Fomitiporia mediterranea MF3/22]